MTKGWLSTLLLLAMTIAFACTGGMPAEFPAPDFTLRSPLTNKETSFAAVKGKPVVIYWFTSW
jgi:hypothetical protein